MIFNPTEKSVPCPLCKIDIDLDIRKFPMDKAVLCKCPWCGRKLRITRKFRKRPKKDLGIYFIIKPALKRTGGGRGRVFRKIS